MAKRDGIRQLSLSSNPPGSETTLARLGDSRRVGICLSGWMQRRVFLRDKKDGRCVATPVFATSVVECASAECAAPAYGMGGALIESRTYR